MLPEPASHYLPISTINNNTRHSRPISHAKCLDDFVWMQNLAGMSPCLVSSGVFAACTGPNWDIPPLMRGLHYTPPDNTTANECSCSWSAYNLLGACAACQGFPESIFTWERYLNGCTHQLSPDSFFPVPIPLNIPIPFWAATDPSLWPNKKFDVTAARLLSSQGHQDIVPSPPRPSIAIQASPFKGATFICGIVMGILAVIVLVVDIMLYLRYRKRNRPEHCLQ